MRKWHIGLVVAVLVVLPAGSALGQDTAEVVIVHGVPGFEADILVDGETSDFTGLQFEDVAVVDLAAGSYELGVAEAGSTDPILQATAELVAGASYTVAAHLDTNGDPTLGLFGNENDQAGIQPFHLANFDPVSIIAGGEIVEGFNSVANGETARITISGDVPGVGIGAADSADPVIELGDITVAEDTLLLAYAIGPDEGQDLPTVVTQTVNVAVTEPPEDVAAGSAGLASDAMPAALVALMVLGGLALLAPVVARRRS